jgi:hypothetical protein
MRCAPLHCITLCCIALHRIALHRIALHRIALHRIALHRIALHRTALCQLIANHQPNPITHTSHLHYTRSTSLTAGAASTALGDLWAIENKEGVFAKPNAGFRFSCQVIDVQDFKGKGETTPTAHFYQNLGEAEYVVSVFQYMCLLGYPAEKISILTTYNGQRHLIRDIIEQRCARNPMFGSPGAISTGKKGY